MAQAVAHPHDQEKGSQSPHVPELTFRRHEGYPVVGKDSWVIHLFDDAGFAVFDTTTHTP